MTGGTGSTPLEDGAGPRRLNRWLAGGALALGLAIGAVLGAGVAAVMDDDAAGTVAAPSVTPDTPQDPSPALGAEASMSAACLRAVAAAEQVYELIDDLGSALLDLDARRLDEVVHDLQPLQEQLEGGTAACRVDLGRPGTPTGSGRSTSAPPRSSPAAPPPSPPASPTG